MSGEIVSAPSKWPGRVSRFGTLLNATARKSLMAIAGQGFVSVANFATGIIIGRSCAKEEFGLYALGFSVVVFVSEFQMAFISTPYMVYGPRLRGEARRLYAGSTFVHQLGLSAVVAILLAGAGFVFASGVGSPGLAPVMGTLAVMITFILLREFARRICFAELQVTTAFMLDVAVSVIQIGGLYALARAGWLSARHAYWVLGGACGTAGIVWLAMTRRAFLVSGRQAWTDLKHNWSFAKWVVASSVLWSLSMNFYPWILDAFRGTAEVGGFAACLQLANLSGILLIGAQNFLGPKIATVYADGGATAMRRFVLKATAAFGAPMVLFCGALWFFGDPLVAAVYGSKYAGYGLIVFFLGVNFLMLALSFSFSRALFAVERADVDFVVNLAALTVLLTFGIWMVRAYGALGAALGLVAANTAASAVRWGAFWLYIPRHEPEGAP